MRDSALKLACMGANPMATSFVGEELMRDSALKLRSSGAHLPAPSGVGEELMRDSALKPAFVAALLHNVEGVGEELMRDSALKHERDERDGDYEGSRRRAHARQRFETSAGLPPDGTRFRTSEKSSCATAL